MKFNRDRFARKKGQEWLEWLSDDAPTADTRASRSNAAPTPPQPVVHRPAGGDRPGQLPKTPVAHQSTQSVEPPAAVLYGYERRRPHGQKPVASPRQSMAGGKVISVNLHLPDWRSLRRKLPSWTWRHVRLGAMVTVLTVGASVGTRAVFEIMPTPGGDKPGKAEVSGASTGGKPSFSPIYTQETPEDAKKKSIYDAKKQLYTYEDKLLDAPITLSQQPLPGNLKNNPAALREIARTIGAETTIKTALGDAFVATSENKTSQRLVTIRGDVLIFIETIKTYDEETWKFYLESLR